MAQAYTSVMKFTVDGRPYMKDVHDLFGALVTQIKFETHRYLFRNYDKTFSSDDAIKVLGSLRFSRSLRIPNAHDPTQMVTTVTTTTFNMERGVAKALCQQFLWSRLMFNAVDPSSRSFRDRGLWQLTSKGKAVLLDFSQRTHMEEHPLLQHTDKDRIFSLVILERSDDDQLILTRQNMAPLFRRVVNELSMMDTNTNKKDGLAGTAQHSVVVMDNNSVDKKYNDGPVGASSSSSSFSTSFRGLSSKRNSISLSRSGFSSSTNSNDSPTSDLFTGSTTTSVSSAASATTNHTNFIDRYQLLDNKLLQSVISFRQQQQQRQLASSTNANKNPRFIFSTQQYCEWLVSSCTIASRDEAEAVTTEFLRHGWIEYQNETHQLEQPTIESSKGTLVKVTNRGRNNLTSDTNHSKSHQHKQGQALLSDPASVSPLSTTTPAPAPPPPVSAPMEALPSTAMYTYQQQSSSSSTGGGSTRLAMILKDAQLRSLFTDFLRANFCLENMDFWIDYTNLRRKCKKQNPAMTSQNQMDLLEDAYAIWSSYLCPGAKWELNVDHALQKEMARLVPSMVKLVSGSYASNRIVNISSQSNSQCLRAMLKRFDRVEAQICQLMSSDSVPKFVVWVQSYREKVPGLENGIQMLNI